MMSKIVAHVSGTHTAAQITGLYKALAEVGDVRVDIEIVADVAVEEDAVYAGPPPSYDHAGVTRMSSVDLAQAVRDATLYRAHGRGQAGT